MSNLIIAAIPKEDDYVWKISSEKVPHMTLLFLGESAPDLDIIEMTKFLEHASDFTLERFWLDVEKRGTLGDDEADVLFFRKSEWNIKKIQDFRDALLKNDTIRKAYDGSEQFPEWNPHLTLGYPKSPAKPDNRDYPGFHSIHFDRIALWSGEYEGPTFELKDYDWDMEVSMHSSDAVESGLSHYGKKGMRWGQRMSEVKANRAAKKVAKKDAKFEKRADTVDLHFKLHNATTDAMNQVHIPRINSKPVYEKAANDGILVNDNHPTTQKYHKEFKDAYLTELNKAADKLGTNTSGTRKYAVGESQNALGFKVYTKDVKHANLSDSFEVNLVVDDKGLVTGFELAALKQGALLVGKTLEHYGVKGMRWGQTTKTATPVSVSQKGKKLKTAGGSGKKAHSDAVRTAKIGQTKKKSGVSAISDKDLQSYANRLQLEQRVKGLEFNQKSGPKKFIATLLGNSGKQYANQVGNEAASAAAKKTIAAAAAKKAARTAAKTAAL